MRVLLVEDDEYLGGALRTALLQESYAVDWLKDGRSAIQALQVESFDVMILDLGLPQLSGREVLKDMRSRGIQVPVLILTARDSVTERIDALDTGADDYLTKPFELEEVFARLRALVRRSAGRAEPLITHGDLQVDPASHQVFKAGAELNISPREFALLHKLLENVGRVLSRDQLAQSLYSWDKDVDSNAVEVHIHNLRKKVGNKAVRTVRGVGYIIDKIEQQS